MRVDVLLQRPPNILVLGNLSVSANDVYFGKPWTETAAEVLLDVNDTMDLTAHILHKSLSFAFHFRISHFSLKLSCTPLKRMKSR
jgi:hypothetical protein